MKTNYGSTTQYNYDIKDQRDHDHDHHPLKKPDQLHGFKNFKDTQQNVRIFFF